MMWPGCEQQTEHGSHCCYWNGLSLPGDTDRKPEQAAGASASSCSNHPCGAHWQDQPGSHLAEEKRGSQTRSQSRAQRGGLGAQRLSLLQPFLQTARLTQQLAGWTHGGLAHRGGSASILGCGVVQSSGPHPANVYPRSEVLRAWPGHQALSLCFQVLSTKTAIQM